MKLFSIAFGTVVIPMLLLDLVWLGIMVKRLYLPHLNHLMASSPNFIAALLFYLLYAIGVTLLIVLPALKYDMSLFKVFLSGALFGLVAYATYDLTNQATLRDWPLLITIVDLCWGTILTATVSWLATLLCHKFI